MNFIILKSRMLSQITVNKRLKFVCLERYKTELQSTLQSVRSY